MKVDCSYCGNPAELVTGDKIYPHRPDLSIRWFWRCVPCAAYVGTHKNSRDHAPLGRLANAELRKVKPSLHVLFDGLWRSNEMTRSGAYAWLAEKMGIPVDQAHIGMFDITQCEQALKVLGERK